MSSIEHGSAWSALEAELREDILTGRIRPGERLGEVALAERFAVSRGPVRDALRKLAAAGLVSFLPNIGARVRVFSREDARALYELRAALESDAARWAARRAGQERASGLVQLLGQHAESIAAHPAGAYLQNGKDADFHIVIAEMAQNPLLRNLLADELYPQLALLRRQHRNVDGRGRVALREHENIADAIINGDDELAALLMRRHIEASWNALSGQLEAGDTEK